MESYVSAISETLKYILTELRNINSTLIQLANVVGQRR
jgi:hypothetical protein